MNLPCTPTEVENLKRLAHKAFMHDMKRHAREEGIDVSAARWAEVHETTLADFLAS